MSLDTWMRCCVRRFVTFGSAVTCCLSTSAAAIEAVSAPQGLLLQGYNYTDHYIDSFSVNGQGGGNIFESSPTSGGGVALEIHFYLDHDIEAAVPNGVSPAGVKLSRDDNRNRLGVSPEIPRCSNDTK